MKRIAFFMAFFTFFLGCKCRVAKNLPPMPYWSIAKSTEYQPQSSYLSLGGKNYYIKEAWIEHPHLEKNFRDLPGENYCFVMSFHTDSADLTDLHSYVKEMGNGPDNVWFNLPWNKEIKDTIVVYYRETLDSTNKNKIFLLFKKSSGD